MFEHKTVSRIMACAALTALGVANANAADKGPSIPTCDRKYGTLAIAEPDNNWWSSNKLESPEALIKVFVQQSKCFTLVDRSEKGSRAMEAERRLAASGDLRGGSNLGKGQKKAADYVLVPDISNKNENASGKKIGGLLGGAVGGGIGAALGSVNLKSKTADVVLTLTDMRSSEIVSTQQGHAKKTDIGWAGAGGGFMGAVAAAGASSYANTEIGQVLTQAYADAYTRMVAEVREAEPNAAESNVTQSVTMAKPGKMYGTPDIKGKVVRDLDPGMTLYPSGEKEGIWWKASDELGNEGWVPSTLFQLAK